MIRRIATALRKMKIVPIPIFSDNYSYLFYDEKTKTGGIIDPSEPEKIIPVIRRYGVKLTHILATHHHWDHAGGNTEIIKAFGNLVVVGGSQQVQGVTKIVKNGDEFKVAGVEVVCKATPCHTLDSISYLFPSENCIFTGDTLFGGGCGRFFEGNAEMMYHNMYEVFGKLPDDCEAFCGHEYTYSNLKFAHHILPNSTAISERMNACAHGETTMPTTILLERNTNLFMQVHLDEVKAALGLPTTTSPVQTMTALRARKDHF
eukprot:GCRY01003162.1.p1 GENE.GCRY01003162.1~~GCRY01003162.1.p1  ORF type:complete len:261 (+),score=40.19 GCRY01003162.1:58-840(+)